MCKGRRQAGMFSSQKIITLVSSPPCRAADRNQVSSNIYPGGRFSQKQTPRHPPSATTLRGEGSTQTRTPPRRTFWVQASATTEPAQTTPWRPRLQQTASPSCSSSHCSQQVTAAPSLDMDGEQQGMGGKTKSYGCREASMYCS